MALPLLGCGCGAAYRGAPCATSSHGASDTVPPQTCLRLNWFIGDTSADAGAGVKLALALRLGLLGCKL